MDTLVTSFQKRMRWRYPMFGVNSRCQRSHQSSNPNQTVSAISASAFWKNDLRGDSKWPFHPLVGGHLTPSKGHLTIPKRSLWITRLEKFVYITCSDCSTLFRKTWIEKFVSTPWLLYPYGIHEFNPPKWMDGKGFPWVAIPVQTTPSCSGCWYTGITSRVLIPESW